MPYLLLSMCCYIYIFFPVSFLVYPSYTCFPPTTGEAATGFQTTEKNASRRAGTSPSSPSLCADLEGDERGARKPQNQALTEQEELASFPLDLIRKLTLTFVGAVQYKCVHQGAFLLPQRRHPPVLFLPSSAHFHLLVPSAHTSP